jgi:uncharacterized protein (DUF1697 family)
MTTYVAFLRGINVGKERRVRTADIKVLMESLGYASVVTYLQSGNFVFQAEAGSPGQISLNLSRAIKERFDFELRVLVLTGEELLALLDGNPLTSREDLDLDKLHATILDGQPALRGEDDLLSLCHPPEEVALGERAIYLYCPEGYRNTRLTNSFIEKRLGLSATTRNWRTVTALAQLVRS